jgi:threonine/homoserine/homoserine lactone efflux protein
MDWALFARGVGVGFAIAAPVGAIGLLNIQRTLTLGLMAGLVTGLGAATADAIYGLIAGLGLTAVSTFLADQRLWLGVSGGLFLCYLGVRSFITPPAEKAADVQMPFGLWGAFLSTLFLTLTNPMTIFSFMAVFLGLGVATSNSSSGSALGVVTLVIGVFLGSTAWSFFLSSVTSLMRSRINRPIMVWVNRVAGVILVGFGCYFLLGLME